MLSCPSESVSPLTPSGILCKDVRFFREDSRGTSTSAHLRGGARFLRQLHAHEDSGHEEAEEDADAADEEQQEAVEFGDVGRVGAVQDDEAQASHGEEEAGGQSFHDVLAVNSARHVS